MDFWYVIKAVERKAHISFQLFTNFFQPFSHFDWPNSKLNRKTWPTYQLG